VQSVPRFIAASIHAKARNTVTNEKIPMSLLDLAGSPCRGLRLLFAFNFGASIT
jgi:hypothetical protein